MHAGWGNAMSDAFTMSNGIRQGFVLSPHLFNLYVDHLSNLLDSTGVGCHIGGLPANNFYYADDLALVCPSAGALNVLLRVCERFATSHFIMYSTAKSVCTCMYIPSKGHRCLEPPAIYLNNDKLC